MSEFNASGYLSSVITYLMCSIGCYKIFEKCGVKKIYAFIPIVREYHIGICGNKEKEGRTFAIFAFLSRGISFASKLVPDQSSRLYLILITLALPFAIAEIVYNVRIYLGFIKAFNRKKRWILLFVFFEGLTDLIWGFNKNFQPEKKVENLKEAEAAKLTGVSAETLAKGLTINITERTAIDFFTKKYLLRDIHMTIPTGHMVLLLGGSGAGKTTFVNAVTGYEKADAEILLNQKNVYKEYGSMKYDIGFVPQQDLIRGNDTVYRTLADAATLRLPSDVGGAGRKKRVKEVLEDFGLAMLGSSLVEKLSGGQRKRLSIAMEYISDPSLFILDEPDSGLDGVVARGLFEKLRKIADEGKIVIVITHTPDRVIDLFDDVIVLAKDNQRTGRLAWYGPVDEVYSFFGKDSMEDILLSINQKEEGGEGRANEFVDKYADRVQEKAG